MFLSIKASADDRSPFGDFWFSPVGSHSIAEVRVSATSAMHLSAVFRAVSLVSGHTAMLPAVFYKAGTRERIAKHPLLAILNKRPNRWQNAFEWREMLQGHLELRGRCHNYITADRRGTITDLTPIHPDRIVPDFLPDGDYRWKVQDKAGSTTYYGREEIWTIRGMSSDGITGIGVIDAARESFGAALATQEYASRFFANDAKPTGGWVEYPGTIKDQEARNILTESIRAATTGQKRHGLLTLDRGMKYHEIGVTNVAAQFLETRQFQIAEIARWFGIPPHKLADLSRATFSNIEQQSLEYIQDAIHPRLKRWESSIMADLLFDSEEVDVEFDMTNLLRADSAARSAYINTGVMNGTLTRNEGRAMEGRMPIDGLDEPLRPLNMVEESYAEDEEADAEAAESPAQEAKEPPDEKDGAAATRMQAMIQSNAARVARRLSKSLEGDVVALVSDALAVSAESAIAWFAEKQPTDETELTASLVRLGSNA
jgi:HK97 family phage portal protein